jgi:hypothetical protein
MGYVEECGTVHVRRRTKRRSGGEAFPVSRGMWDKVERYMWAMFKCDEWSSIKRGVLIRTHTATPKFAPRISEDFNPERSTRPCLLNACERQDCGVEGT